MAAETAQQKQRGRPFQKGRSGNPGGKAPGTRNRATMAAQVLLDGEAEALTRKAVGLALAGDLTALRLCLERIVPPRKDRAVEVAVPEIKEAADAPAAVAAILAAIASGEITIAEGKDLSAVVEAFRKAAEIEELERRIAALEQRSPENA
jgi:hypothetical protein